MQTGREVGVGRKDTPFQSWTKHYHHARSARNPLFNRTGAAWPWAEWGREWSRSIIRRKNDRPARTTLQAWFNNHTSDSRSLRVQVLRSPHCSSRACRRSNLSLGRRSSFATVSTSIPRNTRLVAGPSVLCPAMGIYP